MESTVTHEIDSFLASIILKPHFDLKIIVPYK